MKMWILGRGINFEETERSTQSKKKKVIERKEKSTEIAFNNSSFTGIFNKLKSTSNINEEFKVTKSSDCGGSGVMSNFKFGMILTDRNWCQKYAQYRLYISSFEVFGSLIKEI